MSALIRLTLLTKVIIRPAVDNHQIKFLQELCKDPLDDVLNSGTCA